jgi:hypothetical protein
MANTQPRFPAVKVTAILLDSDGNIQAAAARLRCAELTVRRYVQRYPVCAEALKKARERTLDIVESKLVSKAKSGESWAVCFFLKTQGGSRGYQPKLDLKLNIQREAEKLAKEYGLSVDEIMSEAQDMLAGDANASGN